MTSATAPPARSPLAAWLTEARVQYGFEPDALRTAVAETFEGLVLEDLSDEDWGIFVAMLKDFAVVPPIGTDAYRQLPVVKKSRIRAIVEERKHDEAVLASAEALAAAAAGGQR